MIKLGNKDLEAARIGCRAISMIAIGARIVWEALRSCIAGGWWQHGHGWTHGTGWREKGL